MWIVTGPFDVELNDPEIAEKLLKCGKTYAIGRKDCDLTLQSKKVSKISAKIIVGGWDADDIANPDSIPTLRIVNHRPKAMRIHREGQEEMVDPGETKDLPDGCQVQIIDGLPISVFLKAIARFYWREVMCYETHSKIQGPMSAEGCAALGIHWIQSPSAAVTHHLIPSYNLTPPVVASLLSNATLVTQEWLREVLRLGALSRGEPFSLENSFELPSPVRFRPGFATSLRDALKDDSTWEPNEERVGLFRRMKFIFVGETGREVTSEYREVVARGGGEYEAFAVSWGTLRWRKMLAKSVLWAKKLDGKVVLVAHGEAMEAAVGVEAWEDLVATAKE
ncbi:hypothetical protein K488DRAFT_58368 [Vararia minispora EC-137]|uniref:Uncharacterized protein n=1 Tax=Vararia minispora EC-137 TaxID=1314806 RepID=A0ACB8Q9P3_9AGAM|nr:hypothetical protein K488DRAFT_58368 [Vararia minispora EC-137]